MPESGNTDDTSDPGERLVISLVNAIFTLAVQRHADDLHLEPMPGDPATYLARLRIDGVLHEIRRLPQRVGDALIMQIQVMADMSLSERNLPQDGRIILNRDGCCFDLRVSLLPAAIGKAVVIRLLSQSTVLQGMDRINLIEPDMARLQRWLAQPNGMILFTGPADSGKTTTMYSALATIAGETVKTLAVEDPVEYLLPYVTQIQVNPRVNFTFPVALRSFLRQDPDVIMAGEIRDPETLSVAIQTALTGHLLLSTLHTPTAAAGVLRLAELGSESFLITSSLVGISSQRLLRRVCPACRQPVTLDETTCLEVTRRSASGGYVIPHNAVFYRAAGCPACHNTGYSGRMAIYELLELTPAVREAFLNKATEVELTAVAVRDGMTTLAADGIRKAAGGLTTIEEVLRVLGR